MRQCWRIAVILSFKGKTRIPWLVYHSTVALFAPMFLLLWQLMLPRVLPGIDGEVDARFWFAYAFYLFTESTAAHPKAAFLRPVS